MERCDSIVIAVGGLPRDPQPPFYYKAGFSPADVLQEYTRPSRVVVDGVTVIHEALSDPVSIAFTNLGELEAFTTDGLRSLADTLGVSEMIEQTIRYPGHRDLMKTMREMGLFSPQPITVDGQSIVPLDVTSALMFPLWTYEPGEEDLTVMRITATGVVDGEAVTRSWELIDFYDQETNHTSMSRVTAIPCTIVARMILEGRFAAGVHMPESLGAMPGMLDDVLAAHQLRRITYTVSSA
jgi:saccharopine dehydrogenase-like NADP-dependent oxidoreductase